MPLELQLETKLEFAKERRRLQAGAEVSQSPPPCEVAGLAKLAIGDVVVLIFNWQTVLLKGSGTPSPG